MRKIIVIDGDSIEIFNSHEEYLRALETATASVLAEKQNKMLPANDFALLTETSVSTNKRSRAGKSEEKLWKTHLFKRLWMQYPRKEGVRLAERRFTKDIQTESDASAIQNALQTYIKHIEEAGTAPEFYMQGGTWFGRWREWVGGCPIHGAKPCWKSEPGVDRGSLNVGRYAATDSENLSAQEIEEIARRNEERKKRNAESVTKGRR